MAHHLHLIEVVIILKEVKKKERKRNKNGSIITYITRAWPFCKVSVAPSTSPKLFNSMIHIKAPGTPAVKLKGQTANLYSDALITIPL